jgi:hypothetical protein
MILPARLPAIYTGVNPGPGGNLRRDRRGPPAGPAGTSGGTGGDLRRVGAGFPPVPPEVPAGPAGADTSVNSRKRLAELLFLKMLLLFVGGGGGVRFWRPGIRHPAHPGGASSVLEAVQI